MQSPAIVAGTPRSKTNIGVAVQQGHKVLKVDTARALKAASEANRVGDGLSDSVINDLLEKVARQDRAAFREVYHLSAPKLTGVLTRMLRDRSEVEDALQDVYIRVWQRATQFDGTRGAAMGWLVAIARNVALDRLRARPEARGMSRITARSDTPDDDPLAQLPASGTDAEERILASANARRAVECFGELEPERAAAVRGAYLEGIAYKELADRFDVPLNTIRTWLRRSLLRLKECLDR
ncbi:RNA polymerase sigma-70 factor (ECF subfamily) [Roseinatronobacter bogoriensis subsp. barguzinensis]|nr:RNA polymerase sigma-70 factor (ECF subfamily) [Rhodobaca barguzinensis]TDY68783.1 RNA polymerase sigma-70 factor (ECF subfamily) [Rhodobaca bogoriensis DSM 18756]